MKTFAFVNNYYNFDSVVIQSVGTINYSINWNIINTKVPLNVTDLSIID